MLISPNKEILEFIEEHKEIPYDDEFVPFIWSFANKMINNGMKEEGQKLLKKIMANVEKITNITASLRQKLETFQSRYNNIWE